METDTLALIAPPLLEWYGRSARALPWREEPTPYRVWISEIMLQQTRVETVKPYFDRFVAALPDAAALAAAPEERLLKLWEGLGYYSRARNLQKAARLIMERHGGQPPSTYEELRALPGIGPYTAGAVASIAYGAAAPAVDGNVLRVVSRLLASRDDISQAAVKAGVAERLRQVMPAGRAGDFNQALMELGATICLPGREPACARCPVQSLCRGFRRGVAAGLPVKAPRKARRVQARTVLVVVAAGKVALRRRPATGLLAGLWELPGLEGRLPMTKVKAALRERGIAATAIRRLPAAKHIFTHIEWRLTGYRVDAAAAPAGGDWEWAGPAELERDFALPSAFKAYADFIWRPDPPEAD